MTKAAAFRKVLAQPGPLLLPGIQDCLQARIFERQGFPWVYLGGYNASASFLGIPDLGLMCRREIVDHAGRVARSINVPLMVDADDGFGNPIGVMQTVKEFEAAGVAAIHIEDQVAPKRCGHLDGKQVIPTEDMVQKLRAAIDAREDSDFVIMARTDARSVTGLNDAIERGRAYHEAGADIVFIESPYSEDEAATIGEQLSDVTLMWNAGSGRTDEGGKTPWVSPKRLGEMGWKVILLPGFTMRVSAMAIKNLAREIYERGIDNETMIEGAHERFMRSDELHELTGITALLALQERYVSETV